MKQIYNPFLPLDEYIADGEPHLFGDRLYLFGSHDKEGGETFCMLDYCCYSAPIDNLKEWRYDGVIYSSSQDPNSKKDDRIYMYAPDVVQGNDGRYYLYYCLAGYGGQGGFDGPISVAVCDTPGGTYEYLGDVSFENGEPLKRFIPFDPAVINDDGTIRLYYGWAFEHPIPDDATKKAQFHEMMQNTFSKTEEEIVGESVGIMGANCVSLKNDMITVVSEPTRIVPSVGAADGSSFEEHPFFEASSIRKIDDTYYFIYSSHRMHELCYATSKSPDKDFVFGGVIISSGDVGVDGRLEKDRLNSTGNNHGSIEKIGDQWYIFYHRHTHNTSYSRQACAEPITINSDGSIPQVEITSCGLNGAPLLAQGDYPAAIMCNLTNGNMKHQGNGDFPADTPHIVEKSGDRYIKGICNGYTVGYKYFNFNSSVEITITTRGEATGTVAIATTFGGETIAHISLTPSTTWENSVTTIELSGKHALYFTYSGEKTFDFLTLTFK